MYRTCSGLVVPYVLGYTWAILFLVSRRIEMFPQKSILMSLKIPFWQAVTYMPTNVREPTYDVVKSVILNGKIITHLNPLPC